MRIMPRSRDAASSTRGDSRLNSVCDRSATRVEPMGTLTYDSRITASFDDRILAHLQAVIWSKLRRGEDFPFTWTDPMRSGFGRTSVWLSPNVSLSFEYFGSRQPRLNPAWVEALTKSANSPSGLTIVPEPDDPTTP